jgi:hypothetical protein
MLLDVHGVYKEKLGTQVARTEFWVKANILEKQNLINLIYLFHAF